MPESFGNELDLFEQAYVFDSSAGRGSRVYVIDTGLNPRADVSYTNRCRFGPF